MAIRWPLVIVNGVVRELASTDTLPNPYVTSVSASTYTLSNTDSGDIIEFTAACTVTVPTGLSARFNVTMVQAGTGAITVAAGAGATIVSNGSYLSSGGQGAVVGLVLSAATANKYYFYGDRA